MDKVEQTIATICDWIQEEVDTNGIYEKSQVPRMVTDLANLINAKANYDMFCKDAKQSKPALAGLPEMTYWH